ncbi:PRD domain-containing protein [Candidatus Enterococcus ferrettii]|uniref:Beta-glucoside operon transcriptional antiterminator n=1 Tax=Candidatus Enterococcus ferrettii TaxID=2815324 RepID=A0ABV0ETJ4_9ENTE|nr:PRD domain-containing protein [Enterococcus sp. 665A]MBO1342228.1 PRD domain-containing protein [Enterococcus sp. 665A]
MIISQILNNNVAIVKKGSNDQTRGNEVIVYSKGIAFRRKVGDTIEEEEIQKTYVLDSHDKLEHFSYLLSNTQEDYLQIVTKTIEYGEKVIQKDISDYLYLALLDHIDFAIKRLRKSQIIKSPLDWEVRKFYPDHYKIGLYAVDLIEKATGMECPNEEAVSVALHFINLQSQGEEADSMMKMMEAVRNILSIIKYHYRLDFEEDSINYIRLVTHLQYFIVRMFKGEAHSSSESELNRQIRKLYPEAYNCVNKIRIYVKDSFEKDLSEDEEAYLMLHIQRVTKREEDN